MDYYLLGKLPVTEPANTGTKTPEKPSGVAVPPKPSEEELHD
jgi:hypothetical protein